MSRYVNAFEQALLLASATALFITFMHQRDAAATAPLMSTREVTRHRQTGFTESGAQRHPEERPETRLSETTPPHRPHARSRAVSSWLQLVVEGRRSEDNDEAQQRRLFGHHVEIADGRRAPRLDSRTEGLAGEGENSAYESGSEESRWTNFRSGDATVRSDAGTVTASQRRT
ncbi:hypothetical protein HPB51_002264 [Rhipicephalus microplus]|uniref:Secreted protein n=1 Tax=Rhipicephalus microplus TaxID=6941 RepID=A0A9J6DYE5_RHIMP|nr:hypothetical protein HPB51_002264 [Rhipicephalus microplus]